MHALIIEDESLIAMEIEDVLRDCGFSTIAFAVSEATAVEAARNQCPDLITCDVRLNPGSGMDAIHSICREKAIPVIFVTGSADEAKGRYPEHIILTKPFTRTGLRDEVARAMVAIS